VRTQENPFAINKSVKSYAASKNSLMESDLEIQKEQAICPPEKIKVE
jgi:hypothetical protein